MPYADGDEIENAYAAIKQFAGEATGWRIEDIRIAKLQFIHDGKEYVAEVGNVTPFNHEEVIAILASNAYLVCTPNQGVIRNLPILVGRHAMRAIELFD